jgi:hypothetical protein
MEIDHSRIVVPGDRIGEGGTERLSQSDGRSEGYRNGGTMRRYGGGRCTSMCQYMRGQASEAAFKALCLLISPQLGCFHHLALSPPGWYSCNAHRVNLP